MVYTRSVLMGRVPRGAVQQRVYLNMAYDAGTEELSLMLNFGGTETRNMAKLLREDFTPAKGLTIEQVHRAYMVGSFSSRCGCLTLAQATAVAEREIELHRTMSVSSGEGRMFLQNRNLLNDGAYGFFSNAFEIPMEMIQELFMLESEDSTPTIEIPGANNTVDENAFMALIGAAS